MDQRWQPSTGRAAGDSRSREGLVTEAQRATAGPEVVQFYAARNPAINIEKSFLNVDMVNDGANGFRRTESIAEVVAYGDARAERVKPGLGEGNTFGVTGVYHLPWAYCELDGTTYAAVNDDGSPRLDKSGEQVMLPRYRIIPGREGEAMRYFEAVIAFKASLLPDGQRGIHGYSINLDESRPHLQEISDCFYAAPSKKDPLAMRNGFSKAFGRHPKDPMVEVVDPKTGKTKMVREDASMKMERYHKELKQYLIERGFEVEAERDEARHDRKLSLADYKEVAHDRSVIAAAEAEIEAAALVIEAESEQVAQRTLVVDDIALSAIATAERTEMEAGLVAEATVQQAEEVAVGAEDRGYRRGLSKGRSEGRATGRREGEEIKTAAEKSAERTRAEADRIRRLAVLDTQRQQSEHEERMREVNEKMEAARRWEAQAFAEEQRQVELAEAASRTLREAREAKDAYETAAEQLEINKDELPHLREQFMEEKKFNTRNGERSLAEIADAGAKDKLLKTFGPSADPSVLTVTRGQAKERKAAAAQTVKSAMPTQGQRPVQRSSSVQRQ
ncbi:hypothetical protein [Gordonia malaquae]|uniref:hypothetical protein n=1 Tax=Gordonia malaquae TaxID=410332 RepID=UPI0030FEE31C